MEEINKDHYIDFTKFPKFKKYIYQKKVLSLFLNENEYKSSKEDYCVDSRHECTEQKSSKADIVCKAHWRRSVLLA